MVTVPDRGGPADGRAAQAMARTLDVPCVPRQALARLMEATGARVVLVAGASPAAAWVGGCPVPLRFHGSLGVLRLRALAAGRPDPLASAAGVRPGDRILDATAGACSDALVLAAAVGDGGRVVGLEASPWIHAVMWTGLRAAAEAPEGALAEAARRLELVRVAHLDFLRGQAARSFDLVYLDPMFDAPGRARPEFASLRALAHPATLTAASVAEAARVARRRVVVADAPDGTLLERLGLRAAPGSGRRRRYGLLDV